MVRKKVIVSVNVASQECKNSEKDGGIFSNILLPAILTTYLDRMKSINMAKSNSFDSFINKGAAYNNADKDLAEGVMALRASQRAALNLIKKGKKVVDEDYGAEFEGTPELLKKLKNDTPGERAVEEKKMKGFKNYTCDNSNE